MALYNAEAIVIRVRDFDEADKIAVMLTREEGKVQVIARGARRSRNRYASAMQLFTHVKVALYSGRSMDTCSQIDTVESFRNLREDLLRMAYGAYSCELMDEMIKEKQRNESAYLLLLTTLHLLNAKEYEPEPIRRAYELKLLSILGFRPNLERCVACGQGLGDGPQIRFAPGMGGVLCPSCSADSDGVVRISRGALETIKRLLDGDLRRAHMIRVTGELAKELDRAIGEYIGIRTDRRLKSKEFLDELRRETV